MKTTFLNLLFVTLGFFVFVASAKEDTEILIINKAVNQSQQSVTAPALVPSKATRLRDMRKKREIQTEDLIIRELEKQRLVEEQKRVDKIFGNKQTLATTGVVPAVKRKSNPEEWLFTNKSFISIGSGAVEYPGVENINSTHSPAGFLSFGGYGYGGHLIFDVSVYYSTHYLRTPNINYQNLREKLQQPAVSMAIKLSPVTGKMKPYVGASGSLVYRKWSFVQKSGENFEYENDDDANLEKLKDIADQEWNQSFDVGLAVGADLVLGERLGLNFDIRYHWNVYTENREPTPQVGHADVDILDKRDSVIASGNLRYYF